MKVHVVDGTLELFRCFFGAPRAADASGVEVGAGRGLLQTLVSLLRKPEVTHVAVAFDEIVDVVRPGRASLPLVGPGTDPALRSQYPLGAEIVRALGLTMWPMLKVQADDALATAAARWKGHPDVEQVVLCTTDKDLAQCVEGTKVVMLDRIRKVVIDEEGVIAKFGVRPALIPDYLALVGDAADWLPGIPGWGPKSASVVLMRYGGIEGIPANGASWDVRVRGAARLAEVLDARRMEAILYRELARLRTDVPLPQTLEDLEWRGARPELRELAARIGEEGVLERVPRWRDRASQEQSPAP